MLRNVKVSRMFATGLFVPVAVILIVQAGLSRTVVVPETALATPQLREIPMELDNWNSAGEESLEAGVADYLKPDVYVLRNYTADQGHGPRINLFVAYFKSLQNSYGPHSPSVCLPGAGWLTRGSEILTINVPGHTGPIPVNKYNLEKSNDRILVLYWYQNDRHVWAEEFQAKLHLLPDLLRYHRSDESLVRLVMPIGQDSNGGELAESLAFARSIFPVLAERFASAH